MGIFNHPQQRSLADLYRSYFDETYRYIYSRVLHKETSEDITAELWHKIDINLDQFEDRGSGSFKAWAFTLAHNLVVDHFRGQINTLSLDEKIMAETGDKQSMTETVENEVLFMKCSGALKQLPEKQAETIRLKYFAGFRNKEIAAMLNVAERTVSTNLIKGLDALRQILEKPDSKII
jgi:RNA polymerase sigma-70 factor (ECF subfamily)